MSQPLSAAEVDELRREFPALERYVYLATNGLGILPRRTVEAVRAKLDELANDGIVVDIFRAQALLDQTRRRVARLLGCDTDEVAFSRNTTEGVLWAVDSLGLQPGDEVLAVQGSYPSTVLPLLKRQRAGVVTRLVRQVERRCTPEMIAAAWTARTRALALSWVQFNSGFRADLDGMARVAHARGGVVICDAIQGLGVLPLDVHASGVDVLSAGTQKWLLGLQGLGIFYCRRELLARLDVRHVGNGSLVDDHDPVDPEADYDTALVDAARRFEEGTRNQVGLAALNASLTLFEEVGIERIAARARALTDYAAAAATRLGCRVESPRGAHEWSAILLIAPPPGQDAEALMHRMHEQSIAINCREGCLLMGLHFFNTEADVDAVMEVIGGAAGMGA